MAFRQRLGAAKTPAGQAPANGKKRPVKGARMKLGTARPANAGMAPGSNVRGQPKA